MRKLKTMRLSEAVKRYLSNGLDPEFRGWLKDTGVSVNEWDYGDLEDFVETKGYRLLM